MTGELDCSGFIRVCHDLATYSGRDLEAVMLDQMGEVLRKAIQYTPARTPEQIERRVSRDANFVTFADGTKISLWKKAGSIEMFLADSTYPQYAKRWPKGSPVPKTVGGKTWHNMSQNRFRPELWGSFLSHDAQREKALADAQREKLAAIGLAKQSWWQIAKALGLAADIAPEFVRSARSSKGTFNEGFAEKVFGRTAAVITILNDNRVVADKLDGRAILARALRSHETRFRAAVEKGVFDDVRKRARRYPGVFVQ